MNKRLLIVIVTALLMQLLPGCQLQRVNPWDRDLLSQRKMLLDGYPMDLVTHEQIFYSKEASHGGQGIGGGGCGCN